MAVLQAYLRGGKMKFLILSVLALLPLQQVGAHGFVSMSGIVDPGKMSLGVGFSSVSFDLDADNANLGSDEGEVERQVFGVGVVYGLQPKLNLFGYFGYSMKSEIEGVDDDGQGFVVGAGGKLKVHEHNQFDFNVFTDFRFSSEDYGESAGADLSSTYFELKFGGIINAVLATNVSAFFGAEITPFSNGELENGKTNSDLERDEIFGFIFGVNLFLDGVTIRPEVGFLNEKRLSMNIEFAF